MKKCIVLMTFLFCMLVMPYGCFADNNEDLYCLKDLTVPAGISETELNRALKGAFKGKAEYFVQAEQETGVNAIFLASLSAIESGWGKYPNSKNNLFGWYGTTYYENSFDSIKDISMKIKEMYLTENGKYFEGFGLQDVNIHYNGREEWVNLVKELMYQMECNILGIDF